MRNLRRILPGLATACLAALAAPRGTAQDTTLVSIGPFGQANDTCIYPEITPEGRYVAFQSLASNLVAGDTNGWNDVFRVDLATGTVVRVSVGPGGVEGDADSLEPAIDDSGRYVSFFSYATNLVPGDTNGFPDIFVADVVTGTLTRVSVDSTGVQGNGGSRYPASSADGRWVAFESNATNLVAGDTNGARDVFVHDLQTGTTIRASVGAGGAQGDGESLDAAISGDGRLVAFESHATNLVAGDTNLAQDVFVRDLVLGTTVRVSVDSAGVQGDLESHNPALSPDGGCVAFDSSATNLVAGDTNGADDMFRHELATGVTIRASVSGGGAEGNDDSYDASLSSDGRFLVFASWATNLVPGDTNIAQDIFLRDFATGVTERISVAGVAGQVQGNSFYPAVSADGRWIAFDSLAPNVVPVDVNGVVRDAFLRDRGSPFKSYCAGDGTLSTACPCGNDGGAGRGCENSTGGGGARLEASGSVYPDSVVLASSGELPSALSIFLQGDASNPAGIVFGDGVRCVAGSLKRLYVKNASGGAVSAPGAGDPTISARSAALGDAFTIGATRFYQVYYRDPDGSFCPTLTFNVTNGIRIGW